MNVETPARIRDTHVRNRFTTDNARANKKPDGYSNVTWPVERAYHEGKLQGGKGDPNIRWAAILEYAGVYELAFTRSGRDSTDLDIIRGGSRFSITEVVADAIKKLISIDSHMASKDRKIVRLLCDGHTFAEAVREACGDGFADTVRARVLDALDALDEALSAARESGYRYVRLK